MACFDTGTALVLARRDNLPLRNVRGMVLRVTRGSLWITQEDDRRDLVLRTGDTWVVERDGLTIVEAKADSTVCVSGRHVDAVLATQRTARMPVGTRWTHWRRVALALLTPSASRIVPYF
jgi:hypothetical protein